MHGSSSRCCLRRATEEDLLNLQATPRTLHSTLGRNVGDERWPNDWVFSGGLVLTSINLQRTLSGQHGVALAS